MKIIPPGRKRQTDRKYQKKKLIRLLQKGQNPPIVQRRKKWTPIPTAKWQEISDNARPEIAGMVDNMEDYDIVFVGYPNWWGDMPMIVYNFLESYDFSDKTVIPFCTHGGSGLSGTESTIADITGAEMMDGFDIAGEAAQNQRNKAGEAVTEWLREGVFIG